MKFENKKQKLAPLPVFLRRLGRFATFSFLLIVISIAIGVLGYRHFGHTSWIDSFHMACMILTGMGPTTEMKTNSAKVFSSLYALYSGVAFLTTMAVFFTPVFHRLLHILHVEAEE